jgi:hypothetical protein
MNVAGVVASVELSKVAPNMQIIPFSINKFDEFRRLKFQEKKQATQLRMKT